MDTVSEECCITEKTIKDWQSTIADQIASPVCPFRDHECDINDKRVDLEHRIQAIRQIGTSADDAQNDAETKSGMNSDCAFADIFRGRPEDQRAALRAQNVATEARIVAGQQPAMPPHPLGLTLLSW